MMAMWAETKLPGDYSLNFHAAITEGPGRIVIAQGKEKDCRREGNRFNAFKAVLRRNPGHPTAQKLVTLDLRIEYRQVTPDVWSATVVSRPASTLATEIMQQIFTTPSGRG